MKKNNLMLLLAFILIPLILYPHQPSHYALAAAPSPWQAAQTIRALTFQAQLATLHGETTAPDLLTQAAAIYANDLQPAIAAHAPYIDQWIRDAFATGQTAAAHGDALQLAAARGQLWTGLLWAGSTMTHAAILSNNPTLAQAWLPLREFRQATRVMIVDNPAAEALSLWQSGALFPTDALDIIQGDLRQSYFFRLREALKELDTAVQKNFPSRAAEWVGQAQGYFRILQVDFTTQQGTDSANFVNAQLAALMSAVFAQNWDAIPPIIQTLHTALSAYQPVELAPDRVASLGQFLYAYVNLIAVEYRDGVRDGRITIPIEYQEAVTFHDQAQTLFDELRPTIAQREPTSAERLAQILNQLQALITAKADSEQVSTLVNEALFLIARVLHTQPIGDDTTAAFGKVNQLLDKALAAVEKGRYHEAEDYRLKAYATWDVGPELRLMGFEPELVAQVDGLFWQGYDGKIGLAQAIASRRSPETIRAIRADLDHALNLALVKLNSGPTASGAVIFNTAVIVFREGLEAVVILAALLASMAAAKQRHHRKPVALGAALAFALSILTFILAQQILSAFQQYGERLEAIMSLIAIAVLLLITNWFFHKIYWTGWMASFHRIKSDTLRRERGQFWSLVILGFASIYREGVETVLFLQALVLDAGVWVVVQGVLLGLIGVAAVGYLTFKLQTRLPYKTMLILTGVLIVIVLVMMVGHTLHVMQAVGWMTITPIHQLVLPYWTGVWFGMYTTWETLGGQALAAFIVVGSYYAAELVRWRKRTRRKSFSTLPTGHHTP